MPCERRPIPENRGGARSDRTDTGRLPAETPSWILCTTAPLPRLDTSTERSRSTPDLYRGGRSSIIRSPCGGRAALPTSFPIDQQPTCLRALRPQNSPLGNRWIGSKFWCSANVGQSLQIAAEPAVIDQTSAVFLASSGGLRCGYVTAPGDKIIYKSEKKRKHDNLPQNTGKILNRSSLC